MEIFIFSTLAIGAYILKYYYFDYISDEDIEFLIINQLEDNLIVQNISRFSVKEKIRHHAPVIPAFFLTGVNIFKTGEKHFRKLEVEDENGDEFISYLKLFVRKQELIEIEELDSYEL